MIQSEAGREYLARLDEHIADRSHLMSAHTRRRPPATGAFAEALATGRKVGAANADDRQLMAMFCYDTLQILVGAFSPQLVWEGAQKTGFTTRQLAKLCNDRDLAALDDLQWM